jgi:hypothetical protein
MGDANTDPAEEAKCMAEFTKCMVKKPEKLEPPKPKKDPAC